VVAAKKEKERKAKEKKRLAALKKKKKKKFGVAAMSSTMGNAVASAMSSIMQTKSKTTIVPAGGAKESDMTMKKGGSVASPQKAGAHKPANTGASGVSINPEGVVNIDFKQASEQVDENGVTLG
jgi:hypothetical protein